MIRKKDIDEINNKLDTLTKTTMWKALEYDKIVDVLKSITINVGKAYAVFDENSMKYAVKIDYSVPQTVLYIGDDGEAELNTRFKAMNELNLIPLKDLELVRDAINKAIKLNSGGAENE